MMDCVVVQKGVSVARAFFKAFTLMLRRNKDIAAHNSFNVLQTNC